MMTTPAFASPEEVAREKLGLQAFNPRRSPDRGLRIDEGALAAAFPGLEIGRIDRTGPPGAEVLSITFRSESRFAAHADLMQIPETIAMRDAVARQFMMISGPLDRLARLDVPPLDLMAVLGPQDSFAVATRGSFLVNVKSEDGIPASRLAAALLELLFR